MDNKGQVTKQILAVVISGIALVIGVYVFNEVGGFTTDYHNDHSYALSDPTFSENLENSVVSPWTISDTDMQENTMVTWDGTNEWAVMQDNVIDNSGLSVCTTGTYANLSDNFTVSSFDHAKSATVTWAYQITENDNLIETQIRVSFREPGGADSDSHLLVDDNDTEQGVWHTGESDVSEWVNETGTYGVGIQASFGTDDNDVKNTVVWDNVALNMTTQDQTNVHSIEKELQNAYGMVPIIIIVLIASMIITVLLQFRR